MEAGAEEHVPVPDNSAQDVADDTGLDAAGAAPAGWGRQRRRRRQDDDLVHAHGPLKMVCAGSQIMSSLPFLRTRTLPHTCMLQSTFDLHM